MGMNVTPKMLALLKQLKASPNGSMWTTHKRGVANTSRACARWGLLLYDSGWLTITEFGKVYLAQRGE